MVRPDLCAVTHRARSKPGAILDARLYVETRVPGVYALSETLPDGWRLDSAVCGDGSPVSAIDFQAGESVACTITNSRASALGVPIFSQGGIALIVLMMMVVAAVSLRR